MKLFFTCYFIIIFFNSFYLQAQIQNGGFEEWSSGEPAHWLTNNIDEPNLKLTLVTKSTNTHGGNYALKGEVVAVEIEGGQVGTYSPILQSGDKTTAVFPFSAKPKQIRGYYNFESVGGDRFIANAFLLNGSDVIAVSGVTKNFSTGEGYHELILDLFYTDSLTTPTSIQIIFQIAPPEGEVYAHEGSVFYLDDFPSILLIKPPDATTSAVNALTKKNEVSENLVFISGEKDTIKWKGFGAEKIDIEYSVDNGKKYDPIITKYSADSNRYFWKVPEKLLTREAKIRIKQSTDTSGQAKSIKFTIKPWQLTRIDENNKLELFEIPADGWNFGNEEDVIWPQSWWEQFDYSGTDPYTKMNYPRLNLAFHPNIFSSTEASIFPDWPLFVDVFGINKLLH